MFCLLDTQKKSKEEKNSYFFSDPQKIITTKNLKEVKQKIIEIEKFVDQGYKVVGFFSYEAGYTFEPKLKKICHQNFPFPLLYFGVFEKQSTFIDFEKKFLTKKLQKTQKIKFAPEISKANYLKKIDYIKKKIHTGETFETNFSFKLFFDLPKKNLWNFWENIKKRQKVSFSSFLAIGDQKILSFSPELFFRIKKNKITMKPMKGTIKRGIDQKKDQEQKKILKNSQKNKAENAMIVDLIRNDLNKICEKNSVHVSKNFEIEKYKTLFQATSTIVGALKKNISLFQILSAIFPSGSITGAPKLRTMEIIKKLEKSPRNIYCGAIGFFSKEESCFSVPIRTILWEKNKAEMGIGSGIVFDSDANEEFDECLLKAKFLNLY